MGILLGGVLMLWNLGYLPQLARLWPVPVILVGLVFLYMAWAAAQVRPVDHPRDGAHTRRGRFPVDQHGAEHAESARDMPVFMLVTGISLIPYGFRKKGSARIAIIIPALFISCLAVLFFPFSLHHETGTFASFVGQWWPMILVIFGIALIVSFFSVRRPK